jgi:hypothetical protein
VRQ